jgi:Transposase DDE domain
VHEFVESLFEDDLHAKRVLSLGNATVGVLRAGALGIHAIGRGLALARQSSTKHAVKQIDRLVGNDGVDVWELFASWIPFVVASRSEIWVALDWTEFRADGQSTLIASLASSHGRSTPLVWHTVHNLERKGGALAVEEKVLRKLREALPATVTRVVILTDRGFGHVERWKLLQSLGFEFISRIRADIRVTDEHGIEKAASEWVAPGGASVKLKSASLTAEKIPIAAFVAVKMRGMKQEWCLATTLGQLPGSEIVKWYARRFTIEESFRDLKDLRFGMGLSAMHISTERRRDRLLLLSALAVALLTLLGAAGEAAGIDRHFKTNTSKKRQYSLFRQGCDYYEFLPGMRNEWAGPLIGKFAELLSAHSVFNQALGLI